MLAVKVASVVTWFEAGGEGGRAAGGGGRRERVRQRGTNTTEVRHKTIHAVVRRKHKSLSEWPKQRDTLNNKQPKRKTKLGGVCGKKGLHVQWQ